MKPAASARPDHEVPGDAATYPLKRDTSWTPPGLRAASEWTVRLLVVGVGIWVLLRVLGYFSEITIPVVVAILLSALLHPVYRRMRSVMPSGLAAGLTVLGTLAAIIGLFTIVGTQLVDQFDDLSGQVLQGFNQIRDWVRSTFGISDTQLTEYVRRAKEAASQSSGGGSAGEAATKAGTTVTQIVAGFFIALFSLFFFLHEGERIFAWFVRILPRHVRARAVSSGLIAWNQLGAYSRATLVVAAADAAGIGLGAVVLGVPFAAGIALLVLFGAFIPVVGAGVSGTVAVLLALVAKGPVTALIMLAVVVGVQQLESHVLQPFLLGRAVAVHPLAVILAIAAGIIMGGIVGALVAVPIVAVLNAVTHHIVEDDPPVEDAEDLLAPAERSAVEREVEEHADDLREDGSELTNPDVSR